MGGSVPYFDGKNFNYWKAHMRAYLESIAPEVCEAAELGFPGPYTNDQVKWNARARNAIFESISQEVFSRVSSKERSNEIWTTLVEIHEGTASVCEQKYLVLKAKYDDFKMHSYETCNAMYSPGMSSLRTLMLLMFVGLKRVLSIERLSCSFPSQSTTSSTPCSKSKSSTQWRCVK